MSRRFLAAGLLCLFGASVSTRAAAPSRDLGFEDRVRAQEAIERVYYSHQIGTTARFETAVPRSVIESKVRTYVAQTAALERYWNTEVTDEMLQRELERMARGSRLPDRLVEIYAALGDDPFVIKETLARAILVDRLTRQFYAFDASLHAEARAAAEELHRRLGTRALSALVEHPSRTVVEIEMDRVKRSEHESLSLSPERFRRVRARLPRTIGEASPVRETPNAFVVEVLLDEAPNALRVASYVVPKVAWDAWWAATRRALPSEGLTAAATDGTPLPPPVGGRSFDATAACAAADTWDNGILDDLPEARESHTAVWTGSVMVVFGGWVTEGPPTNTGGRYDPATDTWLPTSTVAAPFLALHAAVWNGSQMIVWGGVDAPGHLTSAGGRYDPVADAWTATATTGAPSGRWQHTAVWTGSVMVVWGGHDDTTYFNSGARYDPAADSWSSTQTTGAPAVRAQHTAVWTGSTMVVWGGYNGSAYLNSGGRYDPVADAWTATALSPVSVRAQHTALWTGTVMVVWGGYNGSAYLSTGGRYDPAANTWTATQNSGAPSARSRHTAVWTGSVMVVWGGYNGSAYLTTGGRYDPVANAWTPTQTTGAPSGRAGHPAVWTGSLMLVWGGNHTNTGGRYDPVGNAWTPTSVFGAPTGRGFHTAVWTGSVMVVWGGLSSAESLALNSGGRYDPATDSWSATSTSGAPSARYHHTAVWSGNAMVVWGGWNGAWLGDGGRYAPATDAWTPVSTTGAPSARYHHSAVWTGDQMIVWSGNTTVGVNNTGGRYDPAVDAWTATSTLDAPSGRIYHTAVWTGDSMVVWGGEVSGALIVDSGGRYDPATNAWTATSGGGAPEPRENHVAVWTGREMVIWGGTGRSSLLDNGGRYDPAFDTWAATSTIGAPSARFDATAIWTGNAMVVWGGEENLGYFPSAGGRYDPVADTWSPTTLQGAPVGRRTHTAAWTGNQMVIWGGGTNTGGRYCAGTCAAPLAWYQDHDGDGYGTASVVQLACAQPVGFAAVSGDCDDAAAAVHPGAPEINDGADNQCPGDPGFGMVDEISGTAVFAADKATFSWPSQPSATAYDVARSTSPDFSTACTAFASATPSIGDPEEPAAGAPYFYVVRAAAPFPGSWGRTSAGSERSPTCP